MSITKKLINLISQFFNRQWNWEALLGLGALLWAVYTYQQSNKDNNLQRQIDNERFEKNYQLALKNYQNIIENAQKDADLKSSQFEKNIRILEKETSLLKKQADNLDLLRKQNDELNQGRIEMTDIRFVSWKKLTADEALKTNWGYSPDLVQNLDDYTVNLINTIVLFDKYNHQRLEGFNTQSTYQECINEIRRLKISEPLQSFPMYRLYKLRFEFTNIGKYPIKLTNSKFSYKTDFEGQYQLIREFKSKLAINSFSKPYNKEIDFLWDINKPFPNKLIIKIEMTYDNNIKKNNTTHFELIYEQDESPTWEFVN